MQVWLNHNSIVFKGWPISLISNQIFHWMKLNLWRSSFKMEFQWSIRTMLKYLVLLIFLKIILLSQIRRCLFLPIKWKRNWKLLWNKELVFLSIKMIHCLINRVKKWSKWICWTIIINTRRLKDLIILKGSIRLQVLLTALIILRCQTQQEWNTLGVNPKKEDKTQAIKIQKRTLEMMKSELCFLCFDFKIKILDIDFKL